jgi:putative oxygen-independent coproporphyrinogen III oxidase
VTGLLLLSPHYPIFISLMLQTPPPLSLYVHLPWCVQKCPYCDFNSHPLRGEIPEQDYSAALIRDLEQDLPRIWGRQLESVFFGGGTPSLFSADTIAGLLSDIRARIPIRPGAEITLEANPGTVEAGRLAGFREAGVNRLSIGIQSFNDNHLKTLGRIHDSESAKKAIDEARAAGFDSFNIDLMFGLPGQTMEQAIADVERAIAVAPEHISLYQLTIEPNTAFGAAPPALPDEDAIWEMQHALQARLADAGYEHYEVSAYARPGNRSRHNLNYWSFGDYLGIGAGAHGKVSDHQGVTRLWKVKHPKDYLRHAGSEQGIAGIKTIPAEELPLEFMMNALRLVEGFPSALYMERTGLQLNSLLSPLERAESLGLIERDAIRIMPTDRGKQYLNDLLALFMDD